MVQPSVCLLPCPSIDQQRVLSPMPLRHFAQFCHEPGGTTSDTDGVQHFAHLRLGHFANLQPKPFRRHHCLRLPDRHAGMLKIIWTTKVMVRACRAMFKPEVALCGL